MQKKILFIDSNHPRLHEMLMQQGFQCDLFYSLFFSFTKNSNLIISELENLFSQNFTGHKMLIQELQMLN